MRNPLEHFWAKAKDTKLSFMEKEESRATLRAGMKLIAQGDALVLTRKERAEGFERLANALTDRPIIRATFWETVVNALNSSFIRVPVTAVIVFVVSTGALAAAAETSLPGDALYTFKIAISEPLMGTFRKSTRKQEAEWSMHLLERRLDEVEAIATTPEARRRVNPAAKALREQTSEFLNAIETMLPGKENEELRRRAMREFDTRANHVTDRALPDQSAHEIIRAMLDERRRIERASASSSAPRVVVPSVRASSSSSQSVISSSSSSSSHPVSASGTRSSRDRPKSADAASSPGAGLPDIR